jgi:hypothetical protein
MDQFYFGGGQGVLDQPVAPQSLNLRAMAPGLLLFAGLVWIWRKLK